MRTTIAAVALIKDFCVFMFLMLTIIFRKTKALAFNPDTCRSFPRANCLSPAGAGKEFRPAIYHYKDETKMDIKVGQY
jgi:hypothetical protein